MMPSWQYWLWVIAAGAFYALVTTGLAWAVATLMHGSVP